MNMGYFYSDEELAHHGILGQKWGVRRFQNADGSLTAAGKRRIYAQGADGGYESRGNRYKRSIQGAKYERDLVKNQKKLDKAYSKGNEKKIAKYELAEKMLKTNKDIMLKDLSENEIKQGRDYIEVQKATFIGSIIAGPVGGGAAGFATMFNRGVQKTQNDINKEEAVRNAEYNKKRNSFKTDEEKDLWQAQKEAVTPKEKNKAINDRVNYAKKTGMYDMEFLERNLDTNEETGEQLKGKALEDAYRKYLRETQ